MPSWPRTIVPARSAPPQFPGGLQSWGGSGKGQGRAVNNAGRIWQEIYEPFDLQSAAGRAFIQVINEYWRESTVFDIQHYLYRTRLGVGGGAPLVQGANQSGNVLNINSAANATAGWLKQGDLIRLPAPTVMLDVRADVATDAFAPLLNGALAAAATAMSIDGTVPGIVEAGETFTIAGESGGPTHTVTGGPYLESPAGQVNAITFTPAIAVGGVADNAAVTFAASGKAKIPISPPIFVGSSPADNAVVTITNPLYRVRLFTEPQLPHAGATGWVIGLQLTFREQL